MEGLIQTQVVFNTRIQAAGAVRLLALEGYSFNFRGATTATDNTVIVFSSPDHVPFINGMMAGVRRLLADIEE